MTLFTRYVLREVSSVFLLTLSALTMALLLMSVGKEAIMQGLSPIHLARLLPYLLPNALLFAIPGTMLLATSLVYGRMSGFGEITALKAAGLSPMGVVWPTILLSTVLSLVTVFLNDLAVSWGYEGARSVVINAVEDIAYGMLRTQRSYATRSFSVNVRRVEGKKLIQPVISLAGSGETPDVTVTAAEAELRSDPGSGKLTIVCRNGTVDMGGTSFAFPDEIEREISLDEASGKSASTSPAHMAMRDIPERIDRERASIERARGLLAAQAAYRMLTGEFSSLGGSAWAGVANQVGELKNTLYRLQTEPPRRWANGFSCLCFTLVGAPLAILLRKADMLTSFFACFGPILLLYYPLMVFGVDRSKAGALPPLSVWLANGILVVCALILLRRVIRY